jgi:hypothetical protein
VKQGEAIPGRHLAHLVNAPC